MLDRVAGTIARHGMFATGQRVGVAVSGGADSVCLLHTLLELAPRWNLRLSVLHLNHRLRARESDEDEEFVRALAERLGIPVTVRAWERAETGAANLEEAAREARLEFFAEALGSGTADRVALGHTRSDQAETVLFRFMRGAGTAGLAGIRPVTAGGIVRPLLEVDRAEVESFLRERGIPWREDSSNASPRFARNRIRHELLPKLAQDWNPAISVSLAHTADWALAEEEYWEAELDRLAAGRMRPDGVGIILDAEALRCLPLAAARRLVRRSMERVKGDLRGIDFDHVSAVLRLAAGSEGHGRVQAAGLDIFRSFNWLRFGLPGEATLENRNYRFPAPVPGRIELPGTGGVIFLELVEKLETSAAPECVYNKGTGWIDWERVTGDLELRNWRPGDQYQPVGSSAEIKIKTLFQEARVPLWERRHWPVLAERSNILWARRFGPAARWAAGEGTRIALAIRDTAEPVEATGRGQSGDPESGRN